MNFDISKLDSLPGKAAGAKAKPKFGPAIRAVCVDFLSLPALVPPALSARSGLCFLQPFYIVLAVLQRPKPQAKPVEDTEAPSAAPITGQSAKLLTRDTVNLAQFPTPTQPVQPVHTC